MPPLLDPADLSPEDRFRELAALLATALARLPRPIPVTLPPSKLLREKSRNELAVSAEKSVTVHAG